MLRDIIDDSPGVEYDINRGERGAKNKSRDISSKSQGAKSNKSSRSAKANAKEGEAGQGLKD